VNGNSETPIPIIRSLDDVGTVDWGAIPLVEFGAEPARREIIHEPGRNRRQRRKSRATAPPRAGRIFGARALSVYRVISQAHEVVTQQDPKTKATNLSFLGKEGLVVATANPPNAAIGKDSYHWVLIRLGGVTEDGQGAGVIGVRAADEEESARLDGLFPGWLSKVEEYDNLMARANDSVTSGVTIQTTPESETEADIRLRINSGLLGKVDEGD